MDVARTKAARSCAPRMQAPGCPVPSAPQSRAALQLPMPSRDGQAPTPPPPEPALRTPTRSTTPPGSPPGSSAPRRRRPSMALLPPGSGARPGDPRVSTACWAAGRSALTPASCGLGLPARCFLEMEGVFMRSRFFLENMVTARPAGTQAPDGAGRPGATFSARRFQALAPGRPHCRLLPYPGSAAAVRLHVTGPGPSFLACTPRPRKRLPRRRTGAGLARTRPGLSLSLCRVGSRPGSQAPPSAHPPTHPFPRALRGAPPPVSSF